ncbi:nucleolin-like [Schistocerca americana]|uniref:nucleolin-like n=1 Tax=Schistocerca americana TaxID=7009 RepID=UPI001F4F5989|nr:nucleolin-like [Schistocerca americana]
MLSNCEMSENAGTHAVCVEADVHVLGSGSENDRVIPDEIIVDNKQENEDVVEQSCHSVEVVEEVCEERNEFGVEGNIKCDNNVSNENDSEEEEEEDDDDDDTCRSRWMVYVEVKVDDLMLNDSGFSGKHLNSAEIQAILNEEEEIGDTSDDDDDDDDEIDAIISGGNESTEDSDEDDLETPFPEGAIDKIRLFANRDEFRHLCADVFEELLVRLIESSPPALTLKEAHEKEGTNTSVWQQGASN